MRFLFYLLLCLQLNVSVPVSLSAQETATPTAAVQASVFRKYRGGHQDLKMPAEITDVTLAANGHYLLIYMKSLRTVSVYDVNEARIVKDLAMATDDAMIAGGAAEMIVVNRQQNLIERWSLASFEREAVKRLLIPGKVTQLDLDFDSYGPLKLSQIEGRADLSQPRKPVFYIDLKTLEEVSPPDPHLVPKLSREEQSFNRKMGYCTHPEYAVSLPYRLDDRKRFPTGENNTEHVSILTRNSAKQLGYAEIGFMGKMKFGQRDPLFTDRKRIYFIPQADQILSIPLSNDRLHISRFELSQLLRKESPYLFVSSLPPGECRRGQDWQYQLELESSSREVAVELSAGPEGMQISDSGKLTWRVPEDFKSDQAIVIVSLIPQDGKTKFQNFSLEIRDQ
ncbi:hypothetical protein [Gimesia sp.]|uniref:hypothetical protein n=1 Tax=Gimesia sp. TaxID=2024833 RepID=UPI003A8FF8AD